MANVNVLPCPRRLSTHSRPPCNSTILLREGKPEPRSFGRTRDASGALLERLEDSFQLILGDPDAGVFDGHLNLPADPPSSCLDTAAGRGELHGVREEVEDHLLQAQRVSNNDVDVWIDDDVQREPLPARTLTNHRDSVFERLAKRRVSKLELHSSCLDFGEVEDLVQQLE